MRYLVKLALASLTTAVPLAATAADFYADKRITFIVGSESGGGHDTYGRTLTRHLVKHIPGNPTIVVQNMPGAGSIKSTNYIYNQAPKDGTVIGNMFNTLTVETLIGGAGVEFDVAKLTWLGSMGKQPVSCVTWKTSRTKTFDDATKIETVVGAAEPAGSWATMPALFNFVAGTKFKIVTGYKGTANVMAVERGEVDGVCGASFGTLRAIAPHWFAEQKINPILHFALQPDPEFPSTPLLTDIVKDPAMRSMLNIFLAVQEAGRVLIAPPGVPVERVEILRKAVRETLADPAFLQDAAQLKMEVTYTDPPEIERLIKAAYATPPEQVAIAAGILGRGPAK
jgi:tripartite-type tricarboxylate transporter receptor subunit TctC